MCIADCCFMRDKLVKLLMIMCAVVQGSADSNYSQHSSDLSLEEDTESRHRENERHALTMLEKARVCVTIIIIIIVIVVVVVVTANT